MDLSKPIEFSRHAREKMIDRGAFDSEVEAAIRTGSPEPARKGRLMFRKNFAFASHWRGKFYAIKQVAPIVAEETARLVVVTVRSSCIISEGGDGRMKLIYDPTVDALSIRLVEERVECETIQLNDQVAIDMGPGERIVAIEVLDASELIPGLTESGVALENLAVSAP